MNVAGLDQPVDLNIPIIGFLAVPFIRISNKLDLLPFLHPLIAAPNCYKLFQIQLLLKDNEGQLINGTNNALWNITLVERMAAGFIGSVFAERALNGSRPELYRRGILPAMLIVDIMGAGQDYAFAYCES